MAYVYRHIRLDTNKPFYIGIGSDELYERANSNKSRNKHWTHVVNKVQYRIEIILDDLTWEEACKKEQEFILLYGRKDLGTGILVNMTNGGEGLTNPGEELRQHMSNLKKGRPAWNKGLSGFIHSEETKRKLALLSSGKSPSEETRKKLREKRVGKKPALGMKHTDEAKKKISDKTKGENNPFYGKTHNENTKSKLSSRHDKLLRFISPTGEVVEEFTTIRNFCKKYNLCRVGLMRLMKGKNKTCKGWTLYELEQEGIQSPL